MNGNAKNTAIMASAGTGKTFQLAMRYIRLLALGARPDTIMALTFTKAAADEMLSRILTTLAECSLSEEKAAMLKDDASLPIVPCAKDCAVWLGALLQSLPRLRISTYDSFFFEIARCYCLEMGLNPKLQIMSQDQYDLLREYALTDILDRYRGKKKAQALFEKVAGLKEDKELRRMKDGILNGLAEMENDLDEIPENVAGNVETDEGCPCIDDLACPVLTSSSDKKNILTWVNSLNAALDKAFVERDLSDLSKNGQVKKIININPFDKIGVAEVEASLKDLSLQPGDCEKLLRALEALGRQNIESRNRETKATEELLREFKAALEARKAKEGLFTFEDITRAVKGTLVDGSLKLEGSDSGLFIYYRLDGQIRHLLIDEFQDTNWQQWLIMRPIVDEVMQSDEDRSFFVVGDVKQSIYGWRGGRMEIFLDLAEYYKANLDIIPLDHSYRSCPAVLDLVNAFFQQDAFAMWRGLVNYKTHTPSKKTSGLIGRAEIRCVKDKGTNGKRTLSKNYIWQEALETIRETRPHERGFSCAVLVRTNNDAEKMLALLRENGIPCAIGAKIKVADHMESANLLEFVKLLCNPHDTAARAAVEFGPLSAVKEACSLDEALSDYRRLIIREGYGVAMRRLASLWKSGSEIPEEAIKESARHLSDFVLAAESYRTDTPEQFEAFLEYMENYTRPQEAQDRNQIVISTIHSAKGLTFDMVIYPVGELGKRDIKNQNYLSLEIENEFLQPPETRSIIKKCSKLAGLASLEYKTMETEARKAAERENMNLAYVALTRASLGLYIITYYVKESNSEQLSTDFKNLCVSQGDSPLVADRTEYEVQEIRSFGLSDWFESHPILKEGSQETKSALLPHPVFKPESERRRQVINPSKLGHLEDENGEAVFFVKEAAMERGTAVHLVCSMISWSDEMPKDLEARLKAAIPSLSETNVTNYCSLVRDYAKNAKGSVFERPKAPCEERREMPFLGIYEGKLIRGTMDRVHFFPNSANPEKIIVYDFKTGKQHAENQTQIDAYVKILKDSYGIENISGELVYLEA